MFERDAFRALLRCVQSAETDGGFAGNHQRVEPIWIMRERNLGGLKGLVMPTQLQVGRTPVLEEPVQSDPVWGTVGELLFNLRQKGEHCNGFVLP